jgi:hypothetical protein
MDRRTFLTGLGTIGAAATGGWATRESSAASARAAGLAKAAGAPGPLIARSKAGTAAAAKRGGFVLGMLAGSSAMLGPESVDYAAHAGRLGWAAWDESMASSRGVFNKALGVPGRVSIMLGGFRDAASANRLPMIESIDVTAHFAIDDGRFVPFHVSSYRAAGFKRSQLASAPIVFDALTPDRVALQIDYALDEKSVASGIATRGSMYLPIGGAQGAGTGLYLLAGPSSSSGMPPELSGYVFSGDPRAPILAPHGGAPDFDHIAFAIHDA